jgi:hypothetical protein
MNCLFDISLLTALWFDAGATRSIRPAMVSVAAGSPEVFHAMAA